MKRIISLLLIALMLSAPVASYADPIDLTAPTLQAGERDVGAAVSPMKKGQSAPFTGVLLSPAAVATVTVQLKSIADVVKLEVDRANNESKVRCDAALEDSRIKSDADAKVAQAKLEASMKENQILTDRLDKEESARSNTIWWAGGGFVVGVATTILTVWGVNQAQK